MASAIPIPTEIELKLAIDPTAIPALWHPALQAVRRGRLRTRRLIAHYYDSPDARLARGAACAPRGSALDPDRAAPPSPRWCGLASRRMGMDRAQCRARPRAGRDDAVAQGARQGAPALGGLVRCFTTEFARRTLACSRLPGRHASRARSSIAGKLRAVANRRLRRAPICEIEIELKDGEVVSVYRLALALMADLPLTVLADSKAARGYVRCGAGPTSSTTSRFAPLARPMRCEALAAVARECLHRISGQCGGLLAKRTPSGSTRCASARGACVPACRSWYMQRPRVRSTAGGHQVAGGNPGSRPRWTLFRDANAAAVAAFARDETLAPGLVPRACARRCPSAIGARGGSGGSSCFAAFPPALFSPPGSPSRARVSTRRAASSGLDAASANLAARAHLRRAIVLIVSRRHCWPAGIASCSSAGAALAHASDQDRHGAHRRQRPRYAAEFFAALFARRRAGAYIDALAELQDVLGRCNDAASPRRIRRSLQPRMQPWPGRSAAGPPRKAPRWRRASPKHGIASRPNPSGTEKAWGRSATS